VRTVQPFNTYNSSGTGQFTALTGRQIFDGSILVAGPATFADIISTFNTSTPAVTSVSVRSYFQETHFTNASSVPVVMKLYDCFCRRDIPVNTVSSSINTILTSSVSKTALIPSGFVTASVNTIGYTPYQNHEFVRYFKIGKTRSMVLQPGGVTRYRMRRKKPFRYDNIIGSTDLILARKGVTRCLLLQAYGTPTNDSKTTTLVSTDPVKINRVTTTRFTYTYIIDSSMSTSASGTQVDRTMTQGTSITDLVSSITSAVPTTATPTLFLTT
jgi:hypothetical protein